MGAPSAPKDSEEYGPACLASPYERGTDGPRTILVGVDGTQNSLRAAAYALGLARRQHCRLIVAFVASPSVFTSAAMGVASIAAIAQEQCFDELAKELKEMARRRAEEYRVPITFLQRRGDAFAELKKIADEAAADMVVVGTSGRSSYRLRGSIANRLVRAGRWPVVAVP